MAANIGKNGIISCSPIEGFDKASIMKNGIAVNSNYYSHNASLGYWYGSVANNRTLDGFTITVSNYSSGVGVTRISQCGFNNYPGPWTVSFDAYSTKPITLTPQVCDITLSCGAVTITPTKQHFSGYATANNYYQPESYNGFIDFENPANASVDGVIIYISNLKIEKGAKATPWCPSDSDGMDAINLYYTNPIQCNGVYEI